MQITIIIKFSKYQKQHKTHLLGHVYLCTVEHKSTNTNANYLGCLQKNHFPVGTSSQCNPELEAKSYPMAVPHLGHLLKEKTAAVISLQKE